jgi:predicted metal-binding membrane protein
MFQSNRCPVSVVLLAVIIACWAWIVPMALDMYGGMSGSSAWMMTNIWDPVHLLLLCAMWVVMMIGMMLPSAAPAVLDLPLFGRLDAKRKYDPRKGFAFMAGYVAIWVGFSLLAFLIQRLLDSSQILSPMMEIRSTRLSIALLAVASAYQFTPLKRASLRSCRCLTATESKSGFGGGIENGLGCLGCCWALMLLLFVGGVMNLWWISGLALFVLAEKLSSLGWQRVCLTALPTVASGLWIVSTLSG